VLSGTASFLHDALGRCQFTAVAPQAAEIRGIRIPLAPISPINPGWIRHAALGGLVNDIFAQGVTSDRIAMLGFSQEACLTLEYVAAASRCYGAIIGLTGGASWVRRATPRNYPGTMEGTPIFWKRRPGRACAF